MTHARVVIWSMLLMCAGVAGNAAAVAPVQTPATKAGMLTVADRYLTALTPKLTPKQKTAIQQITFTLNSKRSVPALREQAIDELVNHTTLALAQTDGIEAVIVTCAHLAKYAPENARAANLFGVALHAIGKNQDAIAVLEYARTLKPKSELVMLNAANVYLDLNQDARARALLDKVIAQNPKNTSAWSALASYWLKQGNQQKALEALMKSATCGGGVVQKKAEPAQKTVEENQVSGNDSIETIEQKLARVNTLTPNTTADLIEDQFPNEAKQIRDRYLKLLDREKMIMPRLPQMNVSGAKNWMEKGEPYVREWQEAFFRHAKEGIFEVTHLQTGVNKGDSEKERERKGLIAAKKEIDKNFADAEKSLKMMEGMPGIPPSQIATAKSQLQKSKAEAMAKLKKRMAEAGISTLDEKPSGSAGTIASDADAEKIGADLVIPGFDYGSPFAVTNYRAYLFIRNDYEIYFMKYYKKVQAEVADILKVYAQKVADEDRVHEENIEEIDRKVEEARKAAQEAGAAFSPAAFEMEYRRENLRYKKVINHISDDYFAQWSTYVFSRYDRKMKPMLDQYWATCALYLRNMNQPDVMKREYCRVKQGYWTYASLAVGMMNGGAFTYYPETDEEERQLEYDIAKAKEDAAAKAKEYDAQTKGADNAIVQWMEDNFALGIAGQFLSLKITPRRLTIEEYIAGMNFKHVYDFKTGDWTTYRSFAAKIDVGIQVGPMKAGVSARADILESYDTYNISNGKLVNCGSSFAKASAGATIGTDNVSVGGNIDVTLDPAAQNQWSVKFGKSFGVKGSPANNVDVGVDAP